MPVVIATWDLETVKAAVKQTHNPTTESTFGLDYRNEGLQRPLGPVKLIDGSYSAEMAFPDDARSKVDEDDFNDQNGKYRSIVKLFMRYEFQAPSDKREGMGTGWLIRPDLLVTAGHCAYDWNFLLGRAISVRAFIGYNGKGSINNGKVQLRAVKTIVTTTGWLSSAKNKKNDLAFMQLSKPFENVNPFKITDTPVSGDLKIGVVGYPLDQSLGDEAGAQMYQMFRQTKFDRKYSDSHLLDYTISTAQGQSGSPVLVMKPASEEITVAMAVHTYRGDRGDVNSATPFGIYGNSFQDYMNYFEKGYTSQIANSANSGIYVPQVPNVMMKIMTKVEGDVTESGFKDILRKAVSITAPIASTAISIGAPLALGPIGVILAPIASIALNAAAKLAESSFATEGALPGAIRQQGIVERAILGEAAISTILRLDQKTLIDLGMWKKLHGNTSKIYSKIKDVIPVTSKALGPAALHLSLVHIASAKKGTKHISAPAIPPITTESVTNPRVEGFIKALDRSSNVLEVSEGDAEFSFGDVFSTALRIAPSGISAASTGLEILGKIVPPKTQSTFDHTTAAAFGGLHERAVLGEAALQVLLDTDVNDLQKPRNMGGPQPESILDFFKKVTAKVAPLVLKAAPLVLDAVVPVVKNALAGAPSVGIRPALEVPLSPADTAGPAIEDLFGRKELKGDNNFAMGASVARVNGGAPIPKSSSGSIPNENMADDTGSVSSEDEIAPDAVRTVSVAEPSATLSMEDLMRNTQSKDVDGSGINLSEWS